MKPQPVRVLTHHEPAPTRIKCGMQLHRARRLLCVSVDGEVTAWRAPRQPQGMLYTVGKGGVPVALPQDHPDRARVAKEWQQWRELHGDKWLRP